MAEINKMKEFVKVLLKDFGKKVKRLDRKMH